MRESTRETAFRLALPFLILGAMACARGGGALVSSRVDTSRFDGRYRLVAASSFKRLRKKRAEAADGESVRNAGYLLKQQEQQYANFTIDHGVIRSGTAVVQEFSLVRAVQEGGVLRGAAVWHEDTRDSGDWSEVPVRLSLEGSLLEFTVGDFPQELADPVTLKRIPSPAP